jgi:hypothetical protein
MMNDARTIGPDSERAFRAVLGDQLQPSANPSFLGAYPLRIRRRETTRCELVDLAGD